MKKSILALTACLMMLTGAAYAEDEASGLSFSLYGTSKVALGNLMDYEAANLGGGISVEYALPITLPVFEDIGIVARYEIEAPQYKWFKTYPGSQYFTSWVAQNAKLGIFADYQIFDDLYFRPEVDFGVFWDNATYITNPNRKSYEDPIYGSVKKAYPMIELAAAFRAYPSKYVGVEVAPTYTAVMGAKEDSLCFRGQYIGLRGGVSIKVPTIGTMQSWFNGDSSSDKSTTAGSKKDKNSNKDGDSDSGNKKTTSKKDKNNADDADDADSKNASSKDDDSDSEGGFFSKLFGKKNKKNADDADDADSSKNSKNSKDDDDNAKDSKNSKNSKDDDSSANSKDADNSDNEDAFKPTRKALSAEETEGMKKVYNSGLTAEEAKEIRDEWRAKQDADAKDSKNSKDAKDSKDSKDSDSTKSTAKSTKKTTSKDDDSSAATTAAAKPEKNTTGMKKVYNDPSAKDSDTAKKEIKIRKNDNGTINIDIPNLMFVADSSELTDDPQNAETITKLYNILSDPDYENYTVDITGFINPDDPSGWTEAEKVLALDRAIAVKNILVYLGIEDDRVKAQAGDGYTDDAEYNRRVELLLSK